MKLKIILSLLSLGLIALLTNCTKNQSENNESLPLLNNTVAVPAQYLSGGNDAFLSEVGDNIQNENLYEKGLLPDSTFKIYTEVIIGKEGDIDQVKILNYSNDGTIADAISNAIKNTGGWKPARDDQNNKIKTRVILPILIKNGGSSMQDQLALACANILKESPSTFKGFDTGNILIIPVNGCSGCINKTTDFVKTRSKEYFHPEGNLISIFTSTADEQSLRFFVENNNSIKSKAIIDSTSQFSQYLADPFYPLLIKYENGEVKRCISLQAANIDEGIEGITADLTKFEAMKLVRAK